MRTVEGDAEDVHDPAADLLGDVLRLDGAVAGVEHPHRQLEEEEGHVHGERLCVGEGGEGN